MQYCAVSRQSFSANAPFLLEGLVVLRESCCFACVLKIPWKILWEREMRVWKLFKSTNMLFSICFRHQQFNIFSPEFSQKTFHPLKNKSFVVICVFICNLQALLHIQSGLVQDMWLRQTSQKLRMLSMSLSDCQSQILKVRVQDSQFVRNSQLSHH